MSSNWTNEEGSQGEQGVAGDQGIAGDQGAAGERGKTGDTGQQGKTGDAGKEGRDGQTGQQGMQGIQGVAAIGLIGERGATGDHGQDGQRGTEGVQGKAGTPAVSARNRLLALYLGMFLIFGLLAWRSEVNASRIDNNTERVLMAEYKSCLGGVVIIKQFNATQRKLAELELSEPDPESLRADRAKIYLDSLFPLPDCESRNPKNFSSGR